MNSIGVALSEWRCSRKIGVIIGFIVALFLFVGQFAFLGWVDSDSESMIWIARRMALGDALYVDIIDHRFPLPYQFLMVIWKLFGSYSVCAVSILLIVVISLSWAMSLILDGKSFANTIGCIGISFFLWTGCIAGHCEIWSAGAICLSAYVGRMLFEGNTVPFKLWLCGAICMGCIALMKPSICIFCACMILPGVYHSGAWKQFFVAFFVALLIFSIDMAFVIMTAGFDNVVFWLFKENGLYATSSLDLWLSGISIFVVFKVVMVFIIVVMMIHRWFHETITITERVLLIGCATIGFFLCLVHPWSSFMSMSVAFLVWLDNNNLSILGIITQVLGIFFAIMMYMSSMYTHDTESIIEIVHDSKSVAPGFFTYSIPVQRELGLESPYKFAFLNSVGSDIWMDTCMKDVEDGRWEYVIVTKSDMPFFEKCMYRYKKVGESEHCYIFECQDVSSQGFLECDAYMIPKAVF